jgi:hypothetical protein
MGRVKMLMVVASMGISSVEAKPKGLPIKLSILKEQVGMPSIKKLDISYGCGGSFGTQFSISKFRRISLIQHLEAYGFNHKELSTSGFLSALVGAYYQIGNFAIGLKLGPGYMLQYNYSPSYRVVDGSYKKVSSFQHKAVVHGSLDFSIRINQLKPFVSYDTFVESPFINSSGGLLPHQMLQFGVHYYLKAK